MSNLPPPPDRDHPTFYRAPYRAYVRAQNSTEYPHVHLLGPLEWDCANRPENVVEPHAVPDCVRMYVHRTDEAAQAATLGQIISLLEILEGGRE